jgi:hypothetical protein
MFLLASCKKVDISDSDIPSDIELVRPQSDRTYYEYLKQVEDQATIIVRAIAKETLGQEVDTIYDYVIKKELPTYGYTKREIEVTKVYKGDVNVDDKLVLLQEYYIWTKSDGKKQLVNSSSIKPATKEEEYLLFLRYEEMMGGYSTVGDYQGMFAIPTDEVKAIVEEGTLEQSDLDTYYDDEPLYNLFPLYNEVAKKYFK